MRLFIFTYGLFLILFLDSLLDSPLIGLYTVGSVLTFILLGTGILLKHKKFKVHLPKGKKGIGASYLLLVMLFFLNLFRPVGDKLEILRILLFTGIIGECAYYIKRYEIIDRFVVISYFIPSLFITWCFVHSGGYVIGLSHIINLFGGTRSYRAAMGLYHYNALGMLSSFLLILSIYILILIIPKIRNIFLKNLIFIFVLALDAININALFSSGSRNSIAAIALFAVLLLYYEITANKVLRSGTRWGMRILLILLGIGIMYYSLADTMFELFVSTSRMKNFTVNLPILDNIQKWLFGIGIVPPGYFGKNLLGLNTYKVDNYYLYILLTTGIVGCIMLFLSIIFIIVVLHRRLMIKKDIDSIIILALFLYLLCLGLGETCVLYYFFPVSMVILTIIFSQKEAITTAS